jgi:UDP-N-acetylmuramoylalanine--D-glutamate ligase
VHTSRQRPPLPSGPFLVVGLARSGSAIARLLAARGMEVVGVDAGNPPATEGLQEVGVEVHLDADGSELLPRVNTVVKSPGVPQDAPVVVAARERDMEVVGELELSWRMLPNRFVAVTGTNGKTTVTELLGRIWRTAGEPVAVAGNVGVPLASLVDEVPPEATLIAECSSFQLEDSVAFAPECAVFLNLAPDHLDRHRTLGEYLDAKLRIFANQDPGDAAVFNADDPAIRGVELGGEGRRVAFCRDREDCDVTLADGEIVADGEPLISADRLLLLGEHNIDNAMAAAAAALAMGIDRAAVADALSGFEGVPHRLERAGEVDGVLYVNDSKATNVAAALTGLRAFHGGVWVILGGRGKGESFAPMLGPVIERCRGCLLIGEAAEDLREALEPARERGVELRVCAGLQEAVAVAAESARDGEVVLLSPACASFDAYRDFEERGDHFRMLVERLR